MTIFLSDAALEFDGGDMQSVLAMFPRGSRMVIEVPTKEQFDELKKEILTPESEAYDDPSFQRFELHMARGSVIAFTYQGVDDF